MPSPLQPLLGYEFYRAGPGRSSRANSGCRRRPATSLQGVPREARRPRLRHQADAGGVARRELQTTAKDGERRARRLHRGHRLRPPRAERPAAPRIAPAGLRRLSRARPPRRTAPVSRVRRRPIAAGERVGALLGKLYGVTLEGESRSTIDVQIEEAGRLAATGALRRMLWLPEKLEPKEQRQQRSCRACERAPRTSEHRAPRDQHRESQDVPVAQARRRQRRSRSLPPRRAGAPPLVYLIHDQRDARGGRTVE